MALLALPQHASAQGSPLLPIVEFAAQTAAVESAGIIVHERHINVIATAGPAHFSQDNDALLLMSDGAYRHIHFTSIVENGRNVSVDEVAKRETQANRDLEGGEGFFKQPFDRRYLTDYTYTADRACSCSNDEQAVRFTSSMHDDQHGNGEMIIDALSGHVVSLSYTPFVFPDHANSGSVTETFGQALPGLWTIVRIDRLYSGRVFLVSGHGKVSEVLDHFRRFTDPDAGLAFYKTAMQ